MVTQASKRGFSIDAELSWVGLDRESVYRSRYREAHLPLQSLK